MPLSLFRYKNGPDLIPDLIFFFLFDIWEVANCHDVVLVSLLLN